MTASTSSVSPLRHSQRLNFPAQAALALGSVLMDGLGVMVLMPLLTLS